MATQRIRSNEKTSDVPQHDTIETKSNISPAVPPSVITKLLGFTFAMITFPIGSYFLSVNFIFRGNATYAGGLAALVANVVLITYCVVAFQDDQSEREADEAERKKTR